MFLCFPPEVEDSNDTLSCTYLPRLVIFICKSFSTSGPPSLFFLPLPTCSGSASIRPYSQGGMSKMYCTFKMDTKGRVVSACRLEGTNFIQDIPRNRSYERSMDGLFLRLIFGGIGSLLHVLTLSPSPSMLKE